MANQQLSTNTFTTAKWIVSATASDGTHTTIAGALTSASSGDTIFIRPGTYTENLTLKAGVNLTTSVNESLNPNVTIIGKCTFTAAGTTTLSNLFLQTNSDYILELTGSNASVVNLVNCYLNCTNNAGLHTTVSNSSSGINLYGCNGNLSTGNTLFVSTSSGQISFYGNGRFNTDISTASTISAGTIYAEDTVFHCPITTSGTANIQLKRCSLPISAVNSTGVTHGGTGSNSFCEYTFFTSGTASAVSIGAGATLRLSYCGIQSSNTNAVTGSGTLNGTAFDFYNSSSTVINTTTVTLDPLGTDSIKFFSSSGTTGTATSNTMTIYEEGTYTPTLVGSATAGTTTYTTQQGYYTKIGNVVTLWGRIVITGATGTGNVTLGGFPFTVKNQSNYVPVGVIAVSAAGFSWAAGTTTTTINLNSNNTTGFIGCQGSASVGGIIAMANAAGTFTYCVSYQV